LEEVMDLDIQSILESAQNGQWPIFVGALLTALVALARSVIPKLQKIPRRMLPWIVFVVGLAAVTGGALASGSSWISAVTLGVTAALASMGMWDLGRGVPGMVEKSPNENKPAAGGPSNETPS
jgi:CHASE2 domain-containing sensor protein